ncbi:MAG: hypothetical protein M1838_000853 [Thelocarpon superellum]|nr:MAG: hypothetical protein M1838_000853 [Thelocarpon superellum]
MSTFINFLPPPGEAIAAYDPALSADDQPKSVPSTFIEAMTVRHKVFVEEQQVPVEIELDEDDARSFHWVVYASVSVPTQAGERKGSETATVPVGTIRLVPPPHPPLVDPGNSPPHERPGAMFSLELIKSATHTSIHYDGKEPYVKLTRVATLSAYRGLGLGRLLMDTALAWASQNQDAVLPALSPTSREAAKVEGEPEQRWQGLVLVHSQSYIQGMYARAGFQLDEEMGEWEEGGIPHVGMWKRIPIESKKKH